MTIFTSDEAKLKLDAVLEEARVHGEVRIRSDKGEFIVRPAQVGRSPLDVGSVNFGMSAEEIVQIVREGRERS